MTLNASLLVLNRFGQQAADTIEWSSPRLMCIDRDFTHWYSVLIKNSALNTDLAETYELRGELYKKRGDEERTRLDFDKAKTLK